MIARKTTTVLLLTAGFIALLLLPAEAKNLKSLFDTGVDLYSRGQFKLSMRVFQEALRIEPKFTEALIMKGRCHLKLDEPQLALCDFNAAIKLDKKNARAFLGRAEAYCNLEENAKAMADCNKSVSLDNIQRAFHLRGKLHLISGNYKAAVTDFDRAMKLGKTDANMLLDRAEALIKQKMYQEAVRDCTQALRIKTIENADEIRAYRTRSTAFEAMGKKDLAIKDKKDLQSKFILEWGQP